jgi:putative transposase
MDVTDRPAPDAVAAEIDRLLEVASRSRGQMVPDWALAAAASRLGYSHGHLRRLVARRRGPRRTRWDVDEWLLPLWYAHGNLRALHDDLIATRDELHTMGDLVPIELDAVPASYVTFWRAFDRLPKRYKEFNRAGANGVRSRLVSLRWQATERNEIWQADSCKLDVWVLPHRARTPVRPWLVVFLDDRTRLITAATMCLSQPSAEEAAATCARAMRFKTSPDGRIVYGGKPQRILWDNGGEFIASLMTTLATSVGFVGKPVLRHTPTHKGKVERFFGTFQRWVLLSLPGYGKSPKLSDGSAVFLGDPSELLSDETLWAHIAERIDYYNWQRPHSALGRRTPGEVWADDPTPLTEIPDEALRTAVLRSKRLVAANGDGVAFRATRYLSIDESYDDWIGTKVEIGFLPHDGSFIELFTPTGEWICTAYHQDQFSDTEIYSMLRRRSGALDEIEAAALEAKALRIERASTIRTGDGRAASLVTTSLARRTGRVADPTAPPPQPTLAPDEAWLAASRDALNEVDDDAS